MTRAMLLSELLPELEGLSADLAVTGLVMLVVAWIRQKRAELLHDATQRAAAAPPREPGGAPR